MVHPLFKTGYLAFEFLIADGNCFGQCIESLLHPFRDDIEMPARFGE